MGPDLIAPQSIEASSLELELLQIRIRLGLALLGVVLVAIRPWCAAGTPGARFATARLALLGIVAALSFASYYNFFRYHHAVGFKTTDVYHYYMGSKYFSEVGYHDLYHCSLAALIESERFSRFELPPVRGQLDMRIESPEQALAGSRSCREGFSEARWQSFEEDVGFFDARFRDRHWRLMLQDHGFNPTPVWVLVAGKAIANVPLGSTAFEALLLADRMIILIGIAALGWAFGFEVAAIAMLFWGTGYHWGYNWIGDSLLRNLWLGALLVGLALLRKGKFAAAGGVLSLTSLLRIFPAIFVVGYGAGSLRRWLTTRVVSPSDRRFFAGVAVAAVLLAGLGAATSGRGVAVYAEQSQKMSNFAGQPGANKLGLTSLTQSVLMLSTGDMRWNEDGTIRVTGPPSTTIRALTRALQALVLALAGWLFWRALPRLREWEASALAVTWIPLLSNPANYYYGCFVVIAVLAAERPRLRLVVPVCGVAWLADGWLLHRHPADYLVASLIAVAVSLYTLAVMADQRAPDRA